jgi:hypothetical protein
MKGKSNRLASVCPSTIGSELDCLPSPEKWSRLGESNPGPAHSEFVDKRFQRVRSRPGSDLMATHVPNWTGMNRLQLQPSVQP